MSEIVNPLVSVVLPIYNGEDYLNHAITSVLNQTYSNWELLAADDVSKDSSLDILRSYVHEPRLKLFVNTANSGGIFSNLNYLLKQSKGKYIMVLCQDDCLDIRALSSCVYLLEKHQECDLLFTYQNLIDSEGNSIKLPVANSKFFDDLTCDLGVLEPVESLQSLLKYGSIGGSLTGYFFSRSLLSEIGYFKDTWKYAADWEWSCRVARSKNILVFRQQVINIRIHSKQVSTELKAAKSLEAIEVVQTLLSHPLIRFNSSSIQKLLISNLKSHFKSSLKLALSGRLLESFQVTNKCVALIIQSVKFLRIQTNATT